MKQYLDLVEHILTNGVKTTNRTGVNTISIPHAFISFDMSNGDYPLLTTKKMAFKTMKVELEGFIKGITSKSWYKSRGCHIWNEWCNPKKVPYANDPITKDNMYNEDDLGVIYGSQWRNFNNQGYDQLKTIVDTLKTNPSDRRMVCTAWNPLVLDEVALPSCHYSWVVSVIGDTINLSFTMRSVDVGLGLPFNIASYALLLHLLAKESGLKVGVITGFLNNVHIYENHIDGLKEQLNRKPLALPKIKFNRFSSIYEFGHQDVDLVDYVSHDKIVLDVAV